MKVFVAHSHGSRPDDVCDALDGEMVISLVEPCSSPTCGSHRAMVGVASGMFTTCVTVADLDLSFGDYTAAVREGMVRQAQVESEHDGIPPREVDDAAALAFALWHAHLASRFPVGSSLQVASGRISVRAARAA